MQMCNQLALQDCPECGKILYTVAVAFLPGVPALFQQLCNKQYLITVCKLGRLEAHGEKNDLFEPTSTPRQPRQSLKGPKQHGARGAKPRAGRQLPLRMRLIDAPALGTSIAAGAALLLALLALRAAGQGGKGRSPSRREELR